MKIRMIELKELDYFEENGEYKAKFINTKKVPVAITNYGLKRGKDLGLIEKSLFSDLFGFMQLQDLANVGAEEILKNEDLLRKLKQLFDKMDTVEYLKLIYVAYIAMNRSNHLSFDEFCQQYNEDTETIFTTYLNLIQDMAQQGKNGFAEGLAKNTSKK